MEDNHSVYRLSGNLYHNAGNTSWHLNESYLMPVFAESFMIKISHAAHTSAAAATET